MTSCGWISDKKLYSLTVGKQALLLYMKSHWKINGADKSQGPTLVQTLLSLLWSNSIMAWIVSYQGSSEVSRPEVGSLFYPRDQNLSGLMVWRRRRFFCCFRLDSSGNETKFLVPLTQTRSWMSRWKVDRLTCISDKLPCTPNAKVDSN